MGGVVRRFINFLILLTYDFYFTRCVPKLRYYSDVIHSFDWK